MADIDLQTILDLLIDLKYGVCDVCHKVKNTYDLKIKVFSSNYYIIQCYNCNYSVSIEI
jgi:RNase P subunit RPR2